MPKARPKRSHWLYCYRAHTENNDTRSNFPLGLIATTSPQKRRHIVRSEIAKSLSSLTKPIRDRRVARCPIGDEASPCVQYLFVAASQHVLCFCLRPSNSLQGAVGGPLPLAHGSDKRN